MNPKRRTVSLSEHEIRAIVENCVLIRRNQRELAEKMGISVAVVQKYCRKIRTVLGLSVHTGCPSNRERVERLSPQMLSGAEVLSS